MKIVGVKKLQDIIEKNPKFNFETDLFDNGDFAKIKEVNDNGIKTDKSFVKWEKINDRHDWAKNGVPISINGKWNENSVFTFKLTDEERKNKPYNFSLEKMADLEDKFADYESSLQENKKTKNMKIKLSEVKQIIKEEVDRYKKIQLLETKKKSIEKELKEFLKEIEEEEVEEGIGLSLTNKKGMNAKPEAGHLKEEEMEEGIGNSKTIARGQNKKPETPHKKERY